MKLMTDVRGFHIIHIRSQHSAPVALSYLYPPLNVVHYSGRLTSPPDRNPPGKAAVHGDKLLHRARPVRRYRGLGGYSIHNKEVFGIK